MRRSSTNGNGRIAGSQVLVVGPLPPPIMGPSLYTRTLCDALGGAGARVIHLNTQDQRTVFNTGILDLRNVALAFVHAAQLARLVARHEVGAVYVPISQNRWGYARDALLIAVARAFRRPVVAHLHGANFQPFYTGSTALERWVIRRTLGSADLALSLTPSLRTVYDGIVDDARIGVLENGIDDPWPDGVDGLRAARARRASSEPRRARLLYVANDFAAKGADDLVRAVADPAFEHTHLRMVGAPPPEVAAATRSLADTLGAGHRIELTGERAGRDKLDLFEWADVFVYPSKNDGQPLVLLEALAAGLPILTSTFGGIPDTVGDAAVLVPPSRPDETVTALGALLDDVRLREHLGEAARRRFEDHYSSKRFDARVTDVFASVLGMDRTGAVAVEPYETSSS